MGFLAGKKALIVGLATERSIAWGIAEAMRREGADLAFTYQNDRLKERVVDLAGQVGSTLTMPLDVGVDAELDAAFARIGDAWGGLDIVAKRRDLVQDAVAVEHADGAELDADGDGALEQPLHLFRTGAGRDIPVERRNAEEGVTDRTADAPGFVAGGFEGARDGADGGGGLEHHLQR